MFEENKQKIKYGKEGRKICLKETNKIIIHERMPERIQKK